ncbi:uncharacterized protein LOC113375149 [Ctenocephalides felis]|uniref:uncharacterized protein LOC113375149 n=1 Tax=Ctenocephalides felis TaxID=7515 RepID=UPI000E6E2BBD|nr:uncharacterized protein LOC113375149 [Ctenocephalides felis]
MLYVAETALLLPGALSHSRRVNETSDIRRNLRLRYENDVQHDRALEYCVEFEVIKASKACHRETAYSGLQEGERVLVRCEAEALHRSLGVRCEGHGAPGRATRFAALATPSCRGKWLRLTPSDVPPSDSCLRQQETDSRAQFIFV